MLIKRWIMEEHILKLIRRRLGFPKIWMICYLAVVFRHLQGEEEDKLKNNSNKNKLIKNLNNLIINQLQAKHLV